MVVGTLPVYLGKCSALCPCETPAQSPEAQVEVIKLSWCNGSSCVSRDREDR